MQHVLHTGQTGCYNSTGLEISCHGSGHDGDVQSGIPWPEGRFQLRKKSIHDHLTGLVWLQDANIGTFPCPGPLVIHLQLCGMDTGHQQPAFLKLIGPGSCI